MNSFLLLGLFVSTAGAPSERFEEARALAETAIESGDVPAFAVAVARKDEILWEEAFGLADVERGTPASVETMFSLASVSKPLTATALMVFVERGRIDLDDPVNDYLGSSPLRVRVGSAEKATVRRVANHTAGLPLHHHFFPLSTGGRPPPMAETLRRYGNLVTPPGEEFQYSNLGYGVIEYALEQLAGKDFASLMEEEVFRPLGMKHAGVVLDPEAETRPMAARYDDDGRRLPFYDFDHRGASAVYASVRDLLRFGMLHVGVHRSETMSLLSERSLREMQKPKADMPGSLRYGIGWMIDDNRWPERLVEHGGGMPGVSTSLTLVPSRKIVVVALASKRSRLPDRVTDAVLSEFLHRGGPTFQDRLSQSGSFETRAPRRTRREPPGAFRGLWEGKIETYGGDRSLTLRIGKGTGVHARLRGAPEIGVVGVAFDDDRLTGLLRANIETEEGEGLDTMLRLSLARDDETLHGAVSVMATDALGFPLAVSHWAELTRASTP